LVFYRANRHPFGPRPHSQQQQHLKINLQMMAIVSVHNFS
jgi:hypothetical protein